MGGVFGKPGDHYKAAPEVKTKWLPDFEAKLPSLENKVVAITGCTSGTGLVFACVCARKGAAEILLLNRQSERAEKALEVVLAAVPEDAKSKTTVTAIACDLQSFTNVRKAVEEIKGKYEAIDVLCNNAGVMALEDKATEDGYDVQMQTNHLSHFLLSKELFPLLTKAAELRGEARIVNHSSGARDIPGTPFAEKYYGKNGGNLGGNQAEGGGFSGPRWERYHQSKLANAVFTLALADRLKDTKVKTSVAAPGLAATNLQVTTNSDGGMPGMNIMWMAQSGEDGTMPLLAAAFDPSTTSGDFWEPRGFMRMTGIPMKVKLSKRCTDLEARKKLWELSEEACGTFDVASQAE